LATRLRQEYKAFEARVTRLIKPGDLAGFEAVMAALGDVTKVALVGKGGAAGNS
jgi:hypothetical protein